jgi:single-stranded-DNA-specific exonuclease
MTTRGLTKLWLPRHETSPIPAQESLVARVLRARNLLGEVARQFLEPSLKHLHDPSLLPDLDKAAAKILEVAKACQPIVIYGDYDVDGITAASILYHILKGLHPDCNVSTYVPHRLEEGYGLNAEALATLSRGGASLIVSVDCGITAATAAQALEGTSTTLIITDHHTPPASEADLPHAFAHVHPKKPGATPYPFPDLSGSAVAFKLAWRLATLSAGSDRVGDQLRDLLLDLLALASLGVIADVVPLRGENRTIATFGLRRLRHTRFEGLHALIEASGLSDTSIREEDVGFKLAPRLNAVGRLGHAREAVELLTTATGPRAASIAEQLSRLNDERRTTEKKIFDEACELVELKGMHTPGNRAIVLANAQWHQGVVGIVCSKLVDKYSRPVILMQDHGDSCHGSGRSIDGFSLYDALDACKSHLITFGGHAMAAGLKIDSARVEQFAAEFIQHCNDRLSADDLVRSARFDTLASLDELSQATVARLECLAPFGAENPRVQVCVQGLTVIGRPQTFGAYNKHLSFTASQGQGTPCVRFFGWNWAQHIHSIPVGASVEAIVSPKVNTWGGSSKIECEILDVRLT